jgi:NAD(P)-dependent dehydrogenase (short-subunit alcohol dehydrogenase family)
MTDQRAVVTGAASGLGLALVEELVEAGAAVVGLDLAGDERAATVAAAGATFVACDVTDPAAWSAAADAAAATLGDVTLLTLNAGVMTRSPADPVSGDPLDLIGSPGYRRVFAVNVDGVAFGVQAMIGHLAPGASVAITASEAGISALPFDPYYAMSKHAVVGLVRSMAEPLAARNVRINALCPSGIDTAIVPHDLRAVIPAERFAPPRHIARSLLAMAAQPNTGGTWIPGAAPGDVWEYVVPSHRV